MKTVILASQSPRRLEIMRKHGIEPIVIPSDVDETLPEGADMEEAVRYLAGLKADACFRKLKETGEAKKYNNAVIVAADTIVYKDEIMGKPADSADAFRMLDKIRNTEHYVVTGIALIDLDTGKRTVIDDVTTVYTSDYTDEQIWEYINTVEPYDKAGSYAIQGDFGKYIDHIEGEYENVVGLPFVRLIPYI